MRAERSGQKVTKQTWDNVNKMMPKEIEETRDLLQMTALYNRATGANLTHWEFEQVGILEETKIVLALKALK